MSTQAASGSGKRLLYIDNLRLLLVVIMLFQHLAAGLSGPELGDWYFKAPGELSRLSFISYTLVLVSVQSFYLGFFIMLSGYFTPGSYERQGTSKFLKSRFFRLGVPLLFYVVFVVPPTRYLAELMTTTNLGFGEFLSTYLAAGYSLPGFRVAFVLEAFLIFAVLYVIWRRVSKPSSANISAALSKAQIVLFIFAASIVTFVVRLWFPIGIVLPYVDFQLAYWSQYIFVYVAAIIAFNRNWLLNLNKDQLKFWRNLVVFLLLIYPVLLVIGGAAAGNVDPYRGGWTWQALVLSIWEQFFGISIMLILLIWFREKFNRQSPFIKTLSDSVYAIFILHPVFLALVTLFVNSLDIDLGLQFLIALVPAILLAVTAGVLFKKVPIVKSIL